MTSSGLGVRTTSVDGSAALAEAAMYPDAAVSQASVWITAIATDLIGRTGVSP